MVTFVGISILALIILESMIIWLIEVLTLFAVEYCLFIRKGWQKQNTLLQQRNGTKGILLVDKENFKVRYADWFANKILHPNKSARIAER